MTLPRTTLALAALLTTNLVAQEAALPIATLDRDTPVDFAKEIVPFLQKNCFSCHNEKKAKADLNLESPQAMKSGGESGPALVPGKPMESLVFRYAAHLEDDPMPPAKNKSNAENLSANELALLKLWIEQGAEGTAAILLAGPAEWQPLQDVTSIYSVAITEDGRFVACGRGNRLYVYDLRAGALAAELLDTAAEMKTAHLDNVHSLVFNRYGTLASGGYRNVKLWERRVTEPVKTNSGLPEAMSALATSSEGDSWAAGDAQGNMVFATVGSAEGTAPVKVHAAAVRAVLFDPTGQAVFTASDDKTVARLALPELQDPARIELPSEARALALLDGGQKLAIGGADGVIRVVPLTNFQPPAEGAGPPPPLELKGHSATIVALRTLDESGTQLLSASEDGTARIWNLDGSQARQISHGAAITALDLHRGSHRIATAGADGVTRLWDSTNGNKVGELTGNPDPDREVRGNAATRRRDLAKRVAEMRTKELGEHEKQWNDLKEAAKGEAGKIAVALQDLEAKSAATRSARDKLDRLQREIAALEAVNNQGPLAKAKEDAKKAEEELQKMEGELAGAERAYDAAVRNSELAVRDGTRAGERYLKTLAASTDADAVLAAAEAGVKAIEAEPAPPGPGALRSVAFSPDGETLAVGAETTGLRLWSATTQLPLDTLLATGPGETLAYTPQGALVAGLPDKSLALWTTTASWSKTRQLGDPSDPTSFPDRVLTLAFHPRGHLLATGCGVPSRSAQVKFWRVADGELAGQIEKAHLDTITGLAFSPDGARIASGSTDRFVKIHEVATGSLLAQLEGHTSHVLGVAWSADGETIASAGADHVAKLWVAAEARQKKTEEGFQKELTSITFLGNGEDLLIGSGDKIVKAAGQNLDGVDGFIYDVAASPDGGTIVAGGDDGILRIWQMKDRKLVYSFSPPATEPTAP